MDKLEIKVENNLSGNLVFEDSEYIYSYETENTKKFISLTMPVRNKPYIYNKLHPIFEMHLPEGYLLSIIKKHFSKITKTDDFGLLKVMSPSIRGRVSYQDKSQNKKELLTLDTLLHPKSDDLFDELVSKFALTSALSGVQPKVMATIEDKATLRLDDYIVKSWGDEYKQLSLNEYYCMKVVKLANIPVPQFYLSDDDKLFIMKRFDIKDDGTYLGFEDMCVVFAKQRDDKYDGTYEQIAKAIKIYVSPKHKKKALYNFYKMIVINYLVQNGDAHLKNFGLIYDGIDDINLAPVYDVVSTTVYIKNDIPALHLLGSKKWWDIKYLKRFGKESCDLTNKELEDGLKECKDSISEVLKEVDTRLKNETNTDKIEVLEKIQDIFKL